MVKLPLAGRTSPKKPYIRVTVLVCVLSVLFTFIPVIYGKFGSPAPQCADLFPYDRTETTFKSRSVAIVPGERDHPVRANHQFFNHRQDRFPQHHGNHNMLEMMMEWILQPILYIIRNLKLLYVFLLILLLFYVIYLNIHRGIQFIKGKYGNN